MFGVEDPSCYHVTFPLMAVRLKLASLSDSTISVPYHKKLVLDNLCPVTHGYGTTAVVIGSLGDIVRIGFHPRTCLEAIIIEPNVIQSTSTQGECRKGIV